MNASLHATEDEIEILESIYTRRDHVRQRDLARVVGLSLGMTNVIVKRLVQKGWLTVRKVNNRNIRYVVSANGIDQITRRSYRYLKRTITNIVNYRNAIEQFTCSVKANGYRGVVLAGTSDLDFIVEHTCNEVGIDFLRSDSAWEEARASGEENQKGRGHLFLLYSETYIPDEEERRRFDNVAFLQDVVKSKAPVIRMTGQKVGSEWQIQ
jgi:hypothetical protein